MVVCNACGGTAIEYDAAAGNGFCISCGTVAEENMIVNEVSFGESASGAAVAHGSFIAQGATHARVSGPYGNRSSGESREQTIANATLRIQRIATILRLSEVVCLAATRMYTLAVEHKFTKGRKSMSVAAVCLYVACRQKETRNYMLIDFSDLLQVNVFELGHIYLQFVQTLGLRLPLVDPSHYISRYSSLLEFGDETHKVATDAVRLVQRFDRDWMTRGRRPAGICGAALILAARMNNFRRSIEEIVQVVKIADTTLKKRLEEFRATPSANLTLHDFRSVMLEEEMDPPAFSKGKAKEVVDQANTEDASTSGKKIRRKKRKRPIDNEVADEGSSEVGASQPLGDTTVTISSSDTAVPSTSPGQQTDDGFEASLGKLIGAALNEPSDTPVDPPPDDPSLDQDSMEQLSGTLTEEVSDVLQHDMRAVQVGSALAEAEEHRFESIAPTEELLGLDEQELDAFILDENEVKIKERVWVEMNKDYLEALAAKGDHLENRSINNKRKRQKTNKNPRDTSNPHGATAAESARSMINTNPSKYSKRINYDALKDLFVDENFSLLSNVSNLAGDEDGEFGYLMDVDKTDDGGAMVVIEDSESTMVPVDPHPPSDDEEGDEGGGIYPHRGGDGWDDGYEQEV